MTASQSTPQNHLMDDTPKNPGQTPAEIESARQVAGKDTPGMIWVWDDGSEARAFEIRSTESVWKWDSEELVKEILARPKERKVDADALITLIFGKNPNGPNIITDVNDPVP